MDAKTWLRIHWDRALGWGLVGVGAVVVVLGWDGVASTPFPAEQMSYLVSGAIVGGLLIVVGAALLVSADLRDEWTKLDRIEELLRSGAAPSLAVAPVDAPATPEEEGAPRAAVAEGNGHGRRARRPARLTAGSS